MGEAEVIKRDVEDYNGILCVLQAPICAKIGDKVGICRQNKNKEWAFVAGGIIRKTKNIKVKSDQDRMEENKRNDDNEISQKDTAEKPKRKIKQQRNGKKGVTTIVGLPKKLNFKKLVKKMKNKFSTGATLANDEQNGTVIQIQGDFRHEIVQYIVQLNIVDKNSVTVHGY